MLKTQKSEIIEDIVGLSTPLYQRLLLTEGNAQLIQQYLKEFENEINLSKSYKKITAATLVYCSKFHSNKSFKEITKDRKYNTNVEEQKHSRNL